MYLKVHSKYIDSCNGGNDSLRYYRYIVNENNTATRAKCSASLRRLPNLPANYTKEDADYVILHALVSNPDSGGKVMQSLVMNINNKLMQISKQIIKRN
jgi:hypothetical protein